MKCRIIKMRRAGVDIPRFALKEQVSWRGELIIMDIRDEGVSRQIRVAKHTRDTGDGTTSEVLYEPHIIWLNLDRFTLAGFERVLDGEKIIHYAQSWLCTTEQE